MRSLRTELVARSLSQNPRSAVEDPRLLRLLGWRRNRKEGSRITRYVVESIDKVVTPKPLDSDKRLARVLVENRRELARLDRYERRALSRRKSAIRAFDLLSIKLDGYVIKD